MEIRTYNEWEPLIAQIKARIEEDKVILNFKWPNSLEHICVYKKNLVQNEEIDYERPYRKYTKEEYIKFGGFVDQVKEIGIIQYVVCPYNLEEDYVVWYEEEGNALTLSTGKIQIRYSLKEKKKLFNPRKTIQMSVFCDTKVAREMLCYTKKRGEIPLDSKDGSQFQFVSDFNPGITLLPEIEMDKDEHIRIFLADDVAHKALYWVYKQ